MLVTMSDKELSRINIIQSVVEKRMRRRDAAHQLAWVPYSRRRPRVYQPRYRRDCLGELVQIRMTGLKVERRNAACSSLLMTRLVA